MRRQRLREAALRGHVGRPNARGELGRRGGDVTGDVIAQRVAYALEDVEPPPLLGKLVPDVDRGGGDLIKESILRIRMITVESVRTRKRTCSGQGQLLRKGSA